VPAAGTPAIEATAGAGGDRERNSRSSIRAERTPERARGSLAAVAGRTRIVFSESLAVIVEEELESVRDALSQYEGGQAFPEFKSASGGDVCVASARVAYIERAPADGAKPHAAD
jgi:hypothetical protein